MVNFAAHCTIHAIKNRLSKILYFNWKVLSLKVIHLPKVSIGLAIHLLFITRVHMLLAA